MATRRVQAEDTGNTGNTDPDDSELGDDDEDEENNTAMRALLEEANTKDAPRFVSLSFRLPDGTTRISRNVHQPIAARHSDFVGAMVSTLVGTELASPTTNTNMSPNMSQSQHQSGRIVLDVGEECDDEKTLDTVISWMYGLDPYENEAMSIGTITKLLRLASYLQMPGLMRRCSQDIVSWTTVDADRIFDASDENARQCTELWLRLSTTTLSKGPQPDPSEAVRVALARMLMQRSTDDPVVAYLLSSCSLENLALLTTGVSCTARAIDLALTWGQQHQQPRDDAVPAVLAVLAHIPLETLPACYLRSLLDSGRLLAGDAQLCSAALQKAQESEHAGPVTTGRPAKKAKKAKDAKDAKDAKSGSSTESAKGWVGVLNGWLSTVDSEPSCTGDHLLLGVRRIGCTGIRPEVEGSASTKPAAIVDGKALFFCGKQGMVETGYLCSTLSGDQSDQSPCQWQPFGIVPRSMVGVQYGSVVYGTWVIFVRMTGAGPSCVAFDVAKCTWLVMPDFTARERPCAAVVCNSLYVIGGAVAGAGHGSEAATTERIRLDQCLDGSSGANGASGAPRSAQWEQVQTQLARNGCSAVAIGTRIYVTGGYYRDIERPADSWSVSSDLTCIDTVAGTVENIGSPMHTGRCGHSSFVSSDGKIVVLGGAAPRFRERIVHAESFDFATMKWSPLMPQ